VAQSRLDLHQPEPHPCEQNHSLGYQLTTRSSNNRITVSFMCTIFLILQMEYEYVQVCNSFLRHTV
jgi:hypothetical protein